MHSERSPYRGRRDRPRWRSDGQQHPDRAAFVHRSVALRCLYAAGPGNSFRGDVPPRRRSRDARRRHRHDQWSHRARSRRRPSSHANDPRSGGAPAHPRRVPGAGRGRGADGSVVSRHRPRPRGRRVVPHRCVHQPRTRSSGLPRNDGPLLRRQSRRVHPGPRKGRRRQSRRRIREAIGGDREDTGVDPLDERHACGSVRRRNTLRCRRNRLFSAHTRRVCPSPPFPSRTAPGG